MNSNKESGLVIHDSKGRSYDEEAIARIREQLEKPDAITPRDYFAAKAMASMSAYYWSIADGFESAPALLKCQAETAYEMADAMLAERAK